MGIQCMGRASEHSLAFKTAHARPTLKRNLAIEMKICDVDKLTFEALFRPLFVYLV